MIPYAWTEAEAYRARFLDLRHHASTISADHFVGLNGYAPHVWLSLGVRSILSRAALPCPAGREKKLRLDAIRFVLRRVWSQRHLGVYAGRAAPSDLLIETLDLELVIDAGDLTLIRIVSVLLECHLLLAEAREFPVGPDFFAERAILRSLAASLE